MRSEYGTERVADTQLGHNVQEQEKKTEEEGEEEG